MRNSTAPNKKFTMTPEGSLNHLPISCFELADHDPFLGAQVKTGAQLVSSLALQQLIAEFITDQAMTIRRFLNHFDANHLLHQKILTCFMIRLTRVIQTASVGEHWPKHSNEHLSRLKSHWQQTETIVISGGPTTGSFGQELALLLEHQLGSCSVIHSPWAGKTALVGLAQTVKNFDDLLVIDFGATGVKRAVASHYGNRIRPLKEMSTASYTDVNGKIGKQGFIEILTQTRRELGRAMPVAISLACYLDNGHPFKYASGIYYRLEADCKNLASTLHEQWLPDCGYFGLALLEHDSTAAALAFEFKQPAMMITLGTGLGSGPCPLSPD